MRQMAKYKPMTEAEIFATDMAKEAERIDEEIEQLAAGDERIVTLAKALRMALAQIRKELYEYGTEKGISQDRVDAAFRTILVAMFADRRGKMH